MQKISIFDGVCPIDLLLDCQTIVTAECKCFSDQSMKVTKQINIFVL